LATSLRWHWGRPLASLQERNGSYRVIFRHHGKQHFVTIGKVSRQEAEAKSAQVDYLLLRLKQRLIELPPGVDIVSFVPFDGKVAVPVGGRGVARPVAKPIDLGTLRDRFIEARRGGRENSTQKTTGIHFKHLVGTLGERFPLADLTQADLLRHVNRRAGLGILATTIKEEVTTLRTAWHWAATAGLLSGEYPNAGLVYPKEDEPPPYQTRAEVERQIAAGGMTEDQIEELWDALYLRPHEIAELLEHVRTHARHPWIYPLACLAGHTGARRSELIRIRVADVDFEGGAVTIREKKRVKGKRSTRRAPLTPLLAEALKAWLSVHPGGQALYATLARWPAARSGAAPPATRTARAGRPRRRAAWRR
jgi:integrase